MKTQDLIETAARFVNTTDSHIFLTGKAGTGKTTFLKELVKQTHKRHVIVAPTGIAALNAGGVTIHSQFQLPPGTFLPDRSPSGEFSADHLLYTQYTLNRKHPINSARKQVLRSIDLLIIDEVSMLRADLLDAMDYRMRSVRGNFKKSFGGVQVLMIGDLFQLPPVVKDIERNYLQRYYHSPYFFEAKALETDGFISIELEKIFRQSDNRFIELLNNLRNNIATANDIALLNSYYKTAEEIRNEKGVITITTHNYKADDINASELRNLPGKSFTYKATIEGDFAESVYPVPIELNLKEGTQVMFVRNDTSGSNEYYNGRLATVVKLDDEDVWVEMNDSASKYRLQRCSWENKRYTSNTKTKEMDEEVIGTFSHYPIKLAWAVTVHKSQGLTFDKAVIDVGQAFAPGQVYVALSRLRSLDGLLLRTRVSQDVISNDEKIVSFSAQKTSPEKLQEMLDAGQKYYVQELINESFDFSVLIKELTRISIKTPADEILEDDSMKHPLQLIGESLSGEAENTMKFRNQLLVLLRNNDQQKLAERLEKGSGYYAEIFKTDIQKLLMHIEQMKMLKRKKGYLNELGEIDQLLTKKLTDIINARNIIQAVLSGKEVKLSTVEISDIRKEWQRQADNFKFDNTFLPEKKMKTSSAKKVKGETVTLSVQLFRKKMTIAQIAEKRGLAISTIEGHLAKAVGLGELPIAELMSEEEIEKVENVLKENPEIENASIFENLKGQISYAKIRAVRSISTFAPKDE